MTGVLRIFLIVVLCLVEYSYFEKCRNNGLRMSKSPGRLSSIEQAKMECIGNKTEGIS